MQLKVNTGLNPNQNLVEMPNKSGIAPVQTYASNTKSFKGNGQEQEATKKVKAGVLLTTLAGVGAAMFLTFKHNSKPVPLNNLKDYFMGFKNIKYNEEKYDIEKLVGRLGVGSVTGGLIGGAIFDKKENMNAKYRESIIQLIGNIGTPLLFVAGGGRLFKKYAAPTVIKALSLKSDKAKKVPQILVQTGLLISAIFAGNSVGNEINKTFFKVDEKRKIKLSDMSPHIDDACMSASLVFPESDLISRFIPLALMVAGYSVGTAQAPPLKQLPQQSKNVTSATKNV